MNVTSALIRPVFSNDSNKFVDSCAPVCPGAPRKVVYKVIRLNDDYMNEEEYASSSEDDITDCIDDEYMYKYDNKLGVNKAKSNYTIPKYDAFGEIITPVKYVNKSKRNLDKVTYKNGHKYNYIYDLDRY